MAIARYAINPKHNLNVINAIICIFVCIHMYMYVYARPEYLRNNSKNIALRSPAK